MAIASTPLALNAASPTMNPGRWFLWQVGVKAPGRPNRTTFLSAKYSFVSTGFGPSGVTRRTETLGRRSPTLMVMSRSLTVGGARRGRGRAGTLDDGRFARKAGLAARGGRLGFRGRLDRRLQRPRAAGEREPERNRKGRVFRFAADCQREAIAAFVGLRRRRFHPPAFGRLDEPVARGAVFMRRAEAPAIGAERLKRAEILCCNGAGHARESGLDRPREG